MSFAAKSLRIAGIVLILQLVLVATHLGEFWPFSIYPMFSQAGDPFVRSLARELPPQGDDQPWEVVTEYAELPGEPFALKRVGTNKNDLANFIQKNKSWDKQKIEGLRSLFEPDVQRSRILVYKVVGGLPDGERELYIQYIPFAYLSPDTSFVMKLTKEHSE